MAWLDGLQEFSGARDRAEKALHAPIGMISPLWLAYGAAASAGVAWWWMTRWAKPVNVEAHMAPPVADIPVAIEAWVEPTAALEPETPAPAEVAPEPAPTVATVAEAVAVDLEPLPLVVEMADDLTSLFGIGPKIAIALNERGVTRFAHLAAWTEEALAAFDAEMNLKGKTIRADLIGQARRLADAAV
jgi:NADH-quinone oxidoreductase subunit E